MSKTLVEIPRRWMACISVDWHDILRDWHGAEYI